MKRTNFYFGFQSLLVLVFAMSSLSIFGQGASSCVTNVNISLDGTAPTAGNPAGGTCSYAIGLKDILTTAPGISAAVAISRDGGVTYSAPTATVTVNGADLGKLIKVAAVDANGNTNCWTNVVVEDKAGPIISCPRDILLSCTQIGVNAVPTLVQTGDLGFINRAATNASGALVNVPLSGFYNFTPFANQYGPAVDGSAIDCTPLNINDERFTDFIFDAPCTTGSGPFNQGTALPAVGSMGNVPAADQAGVAAQIVNLLNANTDVVRLIVRQFIATDHYGNKSKPCYQVIGIRKATAVSGPADYTWACNDANLTLSPTVTGYPTVTLTNPNGTPFLGAGAPVVTQIVPGANSCNVAAVYNDVRIDICSGSYKILRTWTVINWCAATPPQTFTQVIKVLDFSEPTVTFAASNYAQVFQTICYTDLWNVDNALVVSSQTARRSLTGSFDYASRQANTLGIPTSGVSPAGSTVTKTVTTINALGNGYSCGGSVSITFSATDLCTNAEVSLTASDNRFTVTKSSSALNAAGVYVTTYTATATFLDNTPVNVTFTAADQCGYALAKKDFRINIIDNVAPEPVCILDTKVAITTDGKNRMTAAALNSGSRDNCAVKQIFVRRMDASVCDATKIDATNTCGTLVPDVCTLTNTDGTKYTRERWRDYVEFGCCDVGNTITVMLGVLDYANNFNFCMVNVLVENKIIPSCVPPAARTITCANSAAVLANLAGQGSVTAFHNCPNVRVTEDPISGSLDNCRTGTYTRSWTLTDCKGTKYSSAVTGCTQVLTFTAASDFIVDFPDDITVDCYAGIPAADSLRNQMLDPRSWAVGRDGAILNNGCGVLAVNVSDQVYTAVPDACRKIIRKICVLDWCKYNPNNDLVDYNADNYGRPKYGDYHGYANASGLYAITAKVPGSAATNLAAWQELYTSPTNTPAGYNGVVNTNNFSSTVFASPVQLQFADPDLSGASSGTNYLNGKERRFQDADTLATLNRSPLNYANNGNTTNYTHPFAFSDGIICFAQIIKVIDNTPPVGTATNQTFCDFGTSALCSGDVIYQIPATDQCNGVSTVFANGNQGQATGVTITWRLTGNGLTYTSTDASGLLSFTNAANRALPYGVYTVTYTVTDLCGNISIGKPFTITVSDCKNPSLTCYDTRSALMNGGTGSVQVWAKEILSSVSDNCATEAQLRAKATITLASATTPGSVDNLTFTCADYRAARTQEVKVWIVDQAGNSNFCRVTVALQDPLNVCTVNATSPLAGVIKTENSQAVANVTVNASANGSTVSASANTDATGAYATTGLTGANYQVRASKTTTDDKYLGVTTYDIALISKHILGIQALNSPYKIIAADVDKSNEVDAADMLALRRFILNITPSLESGVWRFVDKSYVFKNAANPFGEDFPEVVNINQLSNTSAANFVAIKSGDVSQDFQAGVTSTVVRSAKTITLNADDQTLVAGNEYKVTIGSDNFNAQSIQGTFQFNGATVTAVKAGTLANMSDANLGVFTNAVTASWNGTAVASANVAEITFVANKNAKLSDVLSFGSAKTVAVGNDANGNEANVTLKFNTGKVSGGEFALYQNTPNPVENATEIKFNLPTAAKATLSVMNVEGKVLFVKAIDGAAGLNAVSINRSDLGASGVLHYRLDTPEYSATKKMIIVE